MMRPLFLERGWRLRRAAATVVTVLAYGLAVVVVYYCVQVLVGLARIVSQVCP